MTWSEWYVSLYDEEQKLAKKYPLWTELTFPGDLAKQYEAIVLENEDAVVNAIGHFQVHGKWPQLGQPAGAALRERLILAMDIANLFSKFDVKVPKAMCDRSQMEFLMIDAWEWFGGGHSHGSLEDLRDAGKCGKPNEQN